MERLARVPQGVRKDWGFIVSDKKTVTIKMREAKWIVSHLEERKKTFKENTAGWIKVDKLIAIVEEAMKKSLWEEFERIGGV